MGSCAGSQDADRGSIWKANGGKGEQLDSILAVERLKGCKEEQKRIEEP